MSWAGDYNDQYDQHHYNNEESYYNEEPYYNDQYNQYDPQYDDNQYTEAAQPHDDAYDPKLYDPTTREYWLLTLLQAIVRGWHARKQLKWRRLFQKLNDAEKNATRFEKKQKRIRAIEELEYARSILKPFHTEHVARWETICRKLRHLCTNVQQEKYWLGDNMKNEMNLTMASTHLQEGRHVITLFGKETGLYKNRMPVLVVAECKVAIRIVACKIATTLALEGMKESNIAKWLQTLALDGYCQRDTGIPSERWSVACGMSVPAGRGGGKGGGGKGGKGGKGQDKDEEENSGSSSSSSSSSESESEEEEMEEEEEEEDSSGSEEEEEEEVRVHLSVLARSQLISNL